jgi:hypothetical protein
MLPAGMPRLALIWASGRGGSAVSRAISCWQQGGRPMNASRSVACRSPAAVPARHCRPGRPGWSRRPAPSRPPEVRVRRAGPSAFLLGRGGQPAGKRGQIAHFAELICELEPDGLADIGGVGAAQLVPAADRPDQRGVPLDEGLPRLLVAVCGAGHQGISRRVIGHRGADPFGRVRSGTDRDVVKAAACGAAGRRGRGGEMRGRRRLPPARHPRP